ncbi:MAG: tRNA-i(6)A37 methylthiotransferase, partial [uncultured Gemmatimonadetes bacterium]
EASLHRNVRVPDEHQRQRADARHPGGAGIHPRRQARGRGRDPGEHVRHPRPRRTARDRARGPASADPPRQPRRRHRRHRVHGAADGRVAAGQGGRRGHGDGPRRLPPAPRKAGRGGHSPRPRGGAPGARHAGRHHRGARPDGPELRPVRELRGHHRPPHVGRLGVGAHPARLQLPLHVLHRAVRARRRKEPRPAGHPGRGARPGRRRRARGDAAGPDGELVRARRVELPPPASRGGAGGGHPPRSLHQPAPERLHARARGGDGRRAHRLQAAAPARAGRARPHAQAHAAPVHGRRIHGKDRVGARSHARHRALHRHHRGLSRRDRRGVPGHAGPGARGTVRRRVPVQVLGARRHPGHPPAARPVRARRGGPGPAGGADRRAPQNPGRDLPGRGGAHRRGAGGKGRPARGRAGAHGKQQGGHVRGARRADRLLRGRDAGFDDRGHVHGRADSRAGGRV